MTAPQRTSTAWSVCDACGAVTSDRHGHQGWHDEIEQRLTALAAALQPVVAEPPPAITDGEVL